jgi:hypothetical protein
MLVGFCRRLTFEPEARLDGHAAKGQREYRARRTNAWQRAEAWNELLVKRPLACWRVFAREIELKAENMRGVQARIHRVQAHQALEEQPSAYEKHERDGDLSYHEQSASVVAAAVGLAATSELHRPHKVEPRGVKRRTHAKQRDREHRRRCGEHHHRPVE